MGVYANHFPRSGYEEILLSPRTRLQSMGNSQARRRGIAGPMDPDTARSMMLWVEILFYPPRLHRAAPILNLTPAYSGAREIGHAVIELAPSSRPNRTAPNGPAFLRQHFPRD